MCLRSFFVYFFKGKKTLMKKFFKNSPIFAKKKMFNGIPNEAIIMVNNFPVIVSGLIVP